MGNSASAEAEADEALFWAAAHSDAEALAALVAQSANVNHVQREQDGATPCVAACQEGSAECLALLLAHPAIEYDRADQLGYTPCHAAAQWGHANCLRLLLQAGADFRKVNCAGATPAHVAAEHDHVECLRLLVAAGAPTEPTRKSHDGATVYDVAVQSQSDDCVAFLEHLVEHRSRDTVPV